MAAARIPARWRWVALLLALLLATIAIVWGWGEIWLRDRFVAIAMQRLAPRVQLSVAELDIQPGWTSRLILRDVVLASPGEPAPELEVGTVTLSVDLRSLSSDLPRVPEIGLQDVRMRLQRTAGGEWNVAHWLPPGGEDAPALLPALIEQLHVERLQLVLNDPAQDLSFALHVAQLTAGPWSPAQPLQLMLHGAMQASAPAALQLAWEARAQMDMAHPQLALPQQLNDFELRVTGEIAAADERWLFPQPAILHLGSVARSVGERWRAQGIQLTVPQLLREHAQHFQTDVNLAVQSVFWEGTGGDWQLSETGVQLRARLPDAGVVEAQVQLPQFSARTADGGAQHWQTAGVSLHGRAEAGAVAASWRLQGDASGSQTGETWYWQANLAQVLLVSEVPFWPQAPQTLHGALVAAGQGPDFQLTLDARLDADTFMAVIRHEAGVHPPWQLEASLASLDLSAWGAADAAAAPPDAASAPVNEHESLLSEWQQRLVPFSARIHVGELRRDEVLVRNAELVLGAP